MLISLGYTAAASLFSAILTVTSVNDLFSGSTPAPTSLGAQSTSLLRVCYFTTWARYRPEPANMQPSDVDPFLCSHIIMAFAWISDQGRVTLQSDWADKHVVTGLVSMKEVNPALKVLAAVGGWNFGSELFQKVISTEDARRTFAESAVEFMETWSFDGLDLDWEYPNATEKANFTALIKEIHSAFQRHSIDSNKQPFLLAAAVPAAQRNWHGYDVPAIAKYLDFINLMSYDYYGPWDNRTGHNAPLFAKDDYSVAASAKMWVNAGMPKNKVVIGLASYGHAYVLDDIHNANLNASSTQGFSGKFTRTDGFVAYYEACSFITKAQTYLLWDEASLVPYAYNREKWISFDSIESVKIKVRWAAANNFGGVMIWSLAMDDFNGQLCSLSNGQKYPLLTMINQELRKLEPPREVDSQGSSTLSQPVIQTTAGQGGQTIGSMTGTTTGSFQNILDSVTSNPFMAETRTTTFFQSTPTPTPVVFTTSPVLESYPYEAIEGSGEINEQDHLLPTDGLDSLWGQVTITRLPDEDEQPPATAGERTDDILVANSSSATQEQAWSPFVPEAPRVEAAALESTTTRDPTFSPKNSFREKRPHPVPIFLPLPALTPRIDLIGSTIEYANRATNKQQPFAATNLNSNQVDSFSVDSSATNSETISDMDENGPPFRRFETVDQGSSFQNTGNSNGNSISSRLWPGFSPESSNAVGPRVGSGRFQNKNSHHSTSSYTWPPLYRSDISSTLAPPENAGPKRPFFFNKDLLKNKDLVNHINAVVEQHNATGVDDASMMRPSVRSTIGGGARERGRISNSNNGGRTGTPFDLDNYYPEAPRGSNNKKPLFGVLAVKKPTHVQTDEDENQIFRGRGAVGQTCSFDKPIRKDCHSFIQCVLGLEYEMPCPAGTVFNEENGNCDWPSRVPECENAYRTFLQ